MSSALPLNLAVAPRHRGGPWPSQAGGHAVPAERATPRQFGTAIIPRPQALLIQLHGASSQYANRPK